MGSLFSVLKVLVGLRFIICLADWINPFVTGCASLPGRVDAKTNGFCESKESRSVY